MDSEISDSSVVTRGDGWLSAWVGQEHVMMSADTGTCISLSESGGRIWELIEQPRDVNDLCRELAEEYEADPAVLRGDVVAFLEHLKTEQAITVA
jgi:hypothetical protein